MCFVVVYSSSKYVKWSLLGVVSDDDDVLRSCVLLRRAVSTSATSYIRWITIVLHNDKKQRPTFFKS